MSGNGKREIIKVNKYWNGIKSPFITVITPVYNRRGTICRAICSVEQQTFRDIEYIIIDDGSTETIDDIVQKFMNSIDFPVMFIKKTNGGVHTARNVGYRHARGELVLCIDSDDELMPGACETFYKAWMSIPESERKKYWQIKAQCVDQNGEETAKPFPANINSLPYKKARKFFSMAGGEQIGCRVTGIMKENLFPEPNGIKFVAEGVVWIPLENKYKSWGINDIVRIYHKDGNDHLAGSWKIEGKQKKRDNLWSRVYMLNNRKTFGFSFSQYFKVMAKYCVTSIMLIRIGDKKFVQQNKLKGFINNFWKAVILVPSLLLVFCMNRRGK